MTPASDDPAFLPTGKVIPEFEVSNLERSLAFYVQIIGFSVAYARPEDRFVFLDLEDAQLMLEEISTTGGLRTAPLERPYGRGVNLQITVSDPDALLARLQAAGNTPLRPMQERWYRAGSVRIGQREFAMADPDGYVLRFARRIGVKTDQGC
jgi:catechol 2,3-dioxygenase-like lactoylglutathione lyase family enzyme